MWIRRTTGAKPPRDTDARARRRSEWLYGAFQALIWVYGGFLLGVLSYAWWVGNEVDLWPWSATFLLMVVGLVVWQRRRSNGGRVEARKPTQG